jgi:hypothetical protein
MKRKIENDALSGLGGSWKVCAINDITVKLLEGDMVKSKLSEKVGRVSKLLKRSLLVKWEDLEEEKKVSINQINKLVKQ